MGWAEQQFIPYQPVDCVGRGPALVLAPHPDDEVLGCGGAVLRHIERGDCVRVVIVTDGAYGVKDADDRYALTRKTESIRAAETLGYGNPIFWSLPDRGLAYGESLIARILDCIEEFSADFVYAPSWWEIHPDHIALALAAAEAIRRCERPIALAMYEVGVPLHPNTLLDITDLADRKQAAIACFQSQLSKQPYDRHIAALNRYRTYTLPQSVKSAEAFHLVSREEIRTNHLEMIRPANYYARSREGRLESMQPLVSVVVRSMDRPQLADALDSIALQTYPNIEILVVNARGEGHSELPPGSDRFPVRFISHGVPLSRSRAANCGLDNARGEFVAFLDDDDIYYPDHISVLAQALTGKGNVQLAYSGVRVEYYDDGCLARTGELSFPFDPAQLRGRNYIPNNAPLFARSLCEKGCRFDESLDVLEDWDFWLQISCHTAFLHLDRITACYRNFGSSGFGGRISDDYLLKTTAAVFEKWKSIWSGQNIAEIVLRRDAMKDLCEQRRSQLQETLAEQELQYRNCEQLVAQRDELLGRLQRENSALKTDLDDSRSRLANAEAVAESLAQTVRDIYGSTSWEITKPMRTVVSFLRNKRVRFR